MPGFHIDYTIAAVLCASLAAAIFLFVCLWGWSLRLRNASIVDAYWGPGFGVSALIAVLFQPEMSPAAWLLALCAWVWSARIGLHIGARAVREGHEDKRYAGMRKAAETKGQDFGRKSLTTVFMLQAGLQWLIAFPLIFGIAGPGSPLTLVHWAGFAVFASGFALEALADFQLMRFKAAPENAGRICDSGLWAWSRHPNYFGEAVLWWGLWLMAIGGGLHGWTVFAPVLMTVLLTRVSGVPMLEYQMKKHKPGWDEYVRRTSSFVLWPPKA